MVGDNKTMLCNFGLSALFTSIINNISVAAGCSLQLVRPNPGGGALGYFLGGYVPPGTPNWHPVLKKNSPKIDTPF